MSIDVHHDGNVFSFKIQGSLAGSCVVALESAWRTRSATHGANPMTVDLAEVTFVDAAGSDLLSRRRQAGATLIAGPRVESPASNLGAPLSERNIGGR